MRRGATLLIVLVLAVAGFAAGLSMDSTAGLKCSCPGGGLLLPSSTRATGSEARPEATIRSGDRCLAC